MSPIWLKGQNHMNSLLQEQTSWQRSMFEQLMACQALLSQRQNVQSQNVSELNTSMRALLSHPLYGIS